jgi:16S rRNA (guanine527-N7)-methyltransferase
LSELGKGASQPKQPPQGFSLIDVGTGGGFPGLPLKILWPHIRLTLTDSIAKKTNFLAEVAEALGLTGVAVVTARAEELGQDKAHRDRYDAATARAVAALPVLCEYCLPLVKVGGHMLAPKKGDISLELEGAANAARVLGGGKPLSHTFTLISEDAARYVIVVDKLRPTPPGYPRRVGLAKARPLG